MTAPCVDCSENTDPLKLVRDGTNLVDRALSALDPARVPVDERRPEHAMVFASAYSAFLKYVDQMNAEQGTWQSFYASDVAAQLAVVAIEDVAVYRTTVKALLRSLEDPTLPASAPDMIATLGAVFDCLGTLAHRLDTLHQDLPAEPLRGGEPAATPEERVLPDQLRTTLGNLIRSQLSPALQQLIGYYLAGRALNVVDPALAPPGDIRILGKPLESFDALIAGPGLSADWLPDGTDWAGFVAGLANDLASSKSAYGPSTVPVEQVNHLATHNLFTAICERFLAVFARVAEEARAAVQATFKWDGHEPHYALFLAFLQLLEYARAEANGLTAKHLDFYFRRVLQLKERSAEPGHAHVLVELAKHVDAHLLDAGTLLKAGKDGSGADAHFAVDRDLVANKAVVDDLKKLYRHPTTEPVQLLPLDRNRIFASPTTNTGESWDPFADRVYEDGELKSIAMPPAEVGFAIASHYLWLAEGVRHIEVDLVLANAPRDIDVDPLIARAWGQMSRGTIAEFIKPRSKHGPKSEDSTTKVLPVHLRCRLTTEKGWLDIDVDQLDVTKSGLRLQIQLDGNAPPITPFDAATHGYGFATGLPVLAVTLRQDPNVAWDYAALEGVEVNGITLTVTANGLKTVALANDHGPIDASKPFLAYGSAPLAGSALVIGSKEVFQKTPDSVTLHATFMNTPVGHDSTPSVSAEYLAEGSWKSLTDTSFAVNTTAYPFGRVSQPPVEVPDFTPDVPYATTTRAGFIRLKLSGGFGTDTYPVDLATWIADGSKPAKKPVAPVLPTVGAFSLDYKAVQQLKLDAPSEAAGRFFHIAPFGHAQRSLASGATTVPLLPQFRAGSSPAEGELYVGVRALEPPQNLALLFQVVDGTADPRVVKPDNHINWTYLRGNEWVPFAADAVADGTNAMLSSGIVTLAVPADATTQHTLLPVGLHWIRLAVASETDAVCRLVRVAAQALSATGKGAISATAQLPPGTISKLDEPDAAVKAVGQPFPTFGGRPVETPVAFAGRVSERLRHKDRAIALWDYEHLILEAFPGIYQVRCLNHTQYEPSTTGAGIYRELAPGHVTVVTIPDRSGPDSRDPLRPFTSLGVLDEIKQFVAKRVSCFATLHLRNPQFEEVRVDLRVRFRDGVDETFHVNKLKREITEFLSPWAFRSDARPTFNGKVYKSVLVDFVEERPYVDFVSDVHLYHRLPDATADGPDLEEVAGSRAISILVSAPAAKHGVYPIHPDEVVSLEHCACAPAVT
jgi:hypothetical protein